MGLQGYVGSGEDQRRISRYEKQREEKKRNFEKQKQQSDANVDNAGLRVFGAGTSEARARRPLFLQKPAKGNACAC